MMPLAWARAAEWASSGASLKAYESWLHKPWANTHGTTSTIPSESSSSEMMTRFFLAGAAGAGGAARNELSLSSSEEID
jgi:hypothetical protein